MWDKNNMSTTTYELHLRSGVIVQVSGHTVDGALQEWHLNHIQQSDAIYHHNLGGGRSERWHLLVADYKGEALISRIVEEGIFRTGRKPRNLDQIANDLGFTAGALDGWLNEEP
jgi:hypothetical protein